MSPLVDIPSVRMIIWRLGLGFGFKVGACGVLGNEGGGVDGWGLGFLPVEQTSPTSPWWFPRFPVSY